MTLTSMTKLLAVASLAGILGCAGAQRMQTGPTTPGAQGTVQAAEGKNGNTTLQIEVKHLAQPSLLAADATVYVVWVRPMNAAAQNAGALLVNDRLEGELKTLSPHKRFAVLVTPEPSAQVTQPSHEPVFTAEVNRK